MPAILASKNRPGRQPRSPCGKSHRPLRLIRTAGRKLVSLPVDVLRPLGRLRPVVRSGALLLLALGALLLAGCGSSRHASSASTTPTSTLARGPSPAPNAGPSGGRQRSDMNVYSADAAGDLSPVVRGDPALVYVPNSLSNTVDVISQRTLKIVAQFPVGALPQHVTPSYDLRTLYVDNDLGNSLTPIDPRTGQARASDTNRGSLQPVLHPGRPVRDRRRRAAAAPRLPQVRTRCAWSTRCRCPSAAGSITWTSPRTGATRSRAASSPAG